MIRSIRENHYLVDTHAWREYFAGTELGDLAAEVIDLDDNLAPKYTHSLSLCELVRAYYTIEADIEEGLTLVFDNSRIITNIPKTTALRAGELRNQLIPLTRRQRASGISTVDCLLLSVALQYGVKFITGDSDFEVISSPELYGHKPSDFLFQESGRTIQLADYIYFLRDENA